jgi:large subunit ribosomal protein L17
MRHLKKTLKIGSTSAHRRALLANLVCSLIHHNRVRTTLAKAKAARSVADKMVTLGKRNTLHARRQAAAFLRQQSAVKKLFAEVAPRSANRNGGYTRVIRLGRRGGDAAEIALLEWVDYVVPAPTEGEKGDKKAKKTAKTAAKSEAKPAKSRKKSAEKAEAEAK